MDHTLGVDIPFDKCNRLVEREQAATSTRAPLVALDHNRERFELCSDSGCARLLPRQFSACVEVCPVLFPHLEHTLVLW